MKDLSYYQVKAITDVFQKSQVHYEDKFLILFSSYNAWYQAVTGESIDAMALKVVRLRDAIWAEYFRGDCFELLRPLLRRIAVLTTLRPLRSTGSWNGVVHGPDDWEGLIRFWYAVRCDHIHANSVILQGYYPLLTKLAYESLSVFMTEIVLRLQLTIEYRRSAHLIDVEEVSVPRLDEVDLYPRSLFNSFQKKLFSRQISPSKHFTS